jgi:lsr operon transcriptional repressor
MLGRVARLHYEHGFTHQQIGDMLGISRVKVTRMLAEARRCGIVEIRIRSDETIFTDLEVALVERYGLDSAWVAPSFDDGDRLLSSLGMLGAAALTAALEPGMTVAVGLSETVGAVAPHVRVDEPFSALFVPATGSRPGSQEAVQPHAVAQALADAFLGTTRHLPAPVLASSAEAAALLRAEPDVANALELARAADIAIFGIGGMIRGSGILMDGTTPPAQIRELTAAGAVGNISAEFFDRQGAPVTTSLSGRLIGLTLDELGNVPLRIALAGGSKKKLAIEGALAGGYITSLVTDAATAQALLGVAAEPAAL